MGLIPKIVTPFGKWQKGRRRAKKKKKAGTLYADQDFSGSPTASPVDMFGKSVSTPGVAASLSRRRRDKLVGGG
jgi:hypothetical protein